MAKPAPVAFQAAPPSRRRSTRHDAELSIAIDAARRAGRLQMERYERLERIVHKTEHDVVTEVDEMSEQLIISAIRQSYPHDGLLAEESGQVDAIPPVGESVIDPSEQRVWIIDPLDGTVNYANGIPVFCVSIGLAIGGRAVLGVVYDPVRDELFSAQAGLGARLDGAPIRHPAKAKLSDCVVSLALPRGGWSERERSVRRRIRVARVMGSAALTLAYVGNGRFDAFIQGGGLSLWDICAAGLIAEEGGATVTTLDGKPWFDMGRASKSIGIVAAAPAHHRTLMELLKPQATGGDVHSRRSPTTVARSSGRQATARGLQSQDSGHRRAQRAEGHAKESLTAEETK